MEDYTEICDIVGVYEMYYCFCFFQERMDNPEKNMWL